MEDIMYYIFCGLCFGGAVGARHVVIDGLVFNFKLIEVSGGTGDFRSGATGGLDGNGNIGRGHITSQIPKRD